MAFRIRIINMFTTAESKRKYFSNRKLSLEMSLLMMNLIIMRLKALQSFSILYYVYCHICLSDIRVIPKLKYCATVSIFFFKKKNNHMYQTHPWQEKASETYRCVTRWGIRRNRHRKILGEKSPIYLGIERTIEQNGTEFVGWTTLRKSGHRAWREPYYQSSLCCRLNEILHPERSLISGFRERKYEGTTAHFWWPG